jgi:hypothetical protein
MLSKMETEMMQCVENEGDTAPTKESFWLGVGRGSIVWLHFCVIWSKLEVPY